MTSADIAHVLFRFVENLGGLILIPVVLSFIVLLFTSNDTNEA